MKYSLVGIAFFTLLVSCRKTIEKPNWDVDLLAPLVNTTLNINQLLPDSVLQTNPDTSLKLVYSTDIFEMDVDSLFKIPDTTITEIYSVPLSMVAGPGDSFYSNNEERPLNVSNGVELNFAIIESGFIEIEVYNEISEKILITYKILSATKNGDTLSVTELIDAGTPTQQGYLKKRVDISGYHLNLTGINGNKTNKLVTQAVATVDTNGSTVNINSGLKIKYVNTMIDIIPYFVKGYFGSQSYHFGPETTDFSVFNNIIGGTLDLENVDVNITMENGIGVDARLLINQFQTLNTKTNTSTSLTHSIINNPINLNRAQLTNSVPEVSYTFYNSLLSTSNSNIDNLIEIFPDKLKYEIDLLINPLGNISGSNDFVYKKHPLKTKLNIEFPLSLVANNLTVVDTSDFNFSKNSTGNIIDGTLFVYADNGYPFDAELSLDLLDGSNNIIKKLPVVNQISSALVDANLRVVQRKKSVLSIPISQSDTETLYRARKSVITVTFNTVSQPQFIKIYDDYTIDIKVIGDFSYHFN